MQYNIFAMIFNEIKCHINTSFGLVGDASPAPPVLAPGCKSLPLSLWNSMYKARSWLRNGNGKIRQNICLVVFSESWFT